MSNIPIDYEEVTSTTAAARLTQAICVRADGGGVVRFFGGVARYRLDRVNPTPSYGLPIEDREHLVLTQPELIGLRFIAEKSSAPVTARAQFYGRE